MRTLLLALALGTAGITAAPADAQPGYGRHHADGPRYDRGRHRGWDRARYDRGYRGRYYNNWGHGRNRYYYYRHGRRYYGWR